jgi:hypothetical protein
VPDSGRWLDIGNSFFRGILITTTVRLT